MAGVTERVRWRLISDTDVLPVSFVGTSRRSLSEFVDLLIMNIEHRLQTSQMRAGLAPETRRRRNVSQIGRL